MLTISQLLRYTFPVAKRNSALVSLSHIRRGVNKAKQAKIIAKAQTHDQRGRAAQVYTCSCTALDAKKLFTGPVKVSCSCDYFMYTCEYALNRQGAADILYSNGEPPNDKNPTLVPSVCKHLYTMLSDIKSGQV